MEPGKGEGLTLISVSPVCHLLLLPIGALIRNACVCAERARVCVCGCGERECMNPNAVTSSVATLTTVSVTTRRVLITACKMEGALHPPSMYVLRLGLRWARAS